MMELRARRQILLAAGLSLAAHLLLLAMPTKVPRDGLSPTAALLAVPFTAQLRSPELPVPPAEAIREARRERAAPARAARLPAPHLLTVPQSRRAVESRPAIPKPEPEPEPAPAPQSQPSFDMAALIQASRDRRRAAERAELRGPQPGREPGAGESASASLDRNLQTLAQSDGTGGVFEILHVGARAGEFAFNGWRPERGKRWREVIEVDAGSGGDVERAIVRRMIALIREHYPGDFNWQSHRLGRVVVLSAAPENNDALEDYLMREFFGTPLVRRGW